MRDIGGVQGVGGFDGCFEALQVWGKVIGDEEFTDRRSYG
jgi:hypothetical protein